MEDPRISRMYLAMLERGADRLLGRFRSGAWLRSGATWIVLLVLALLGGGIVIHEKGRGNLQKLKTDLGAPAPMATVATAQPGGLDPIVLSRTQRTGGLMPEFLSATLLPGRGLNVLQITVYVPGKGEVALLASPSVAEAARAMTGIGTGAGGDVNGEQSLAMGGAVEVPWAGQLAGTALPGGTSMLANWQGRGLTLPASSSGGGPGTATATGGLLLKRAADAAGSTVMPDGGIAEATFDAGSFDGHWPSMTEVKATVLLSAAKMDLTIVARNTGREPEPMGIGWRPRFALAPGGRGQVMLRLPSTARLERNDRGLPTGRLLPVEGTAYDFSSHGGAALKTMALNDSFVRLKSGPLAAGPEVELRDPAAGYGVRLTVLSPSIKAIRVIAPPEQGVVTIDPQTNYDDPFGREWAKDEDTGLVVLQPGETMQWKVRLELLPPQTGRR